MLMYHELEKSMLLVPARYITPLFPGNPYPVQRTHTSVIEKRKKMSGESKIQQAKILIFIAIE